MKQKANWKTERQESGLAVLRPLSVFFLLGIVYTLWLFLGGPGIPCVFHLITGLRCPGCGITTMLMALMRLDFQEAYQANSFLLISSPLLLYLIGYPIYKKSKGGKEGRSYCLILWFYLIALLAFGVGRNLICLYNRIML